MSEPYFIINGGSRLSGEITTNGSKNSCLAVMAATLLTKEKSTLINVPKIEEVNRFIEVFRSMGVRVQWTGEHELEIDPGQGFDFQQMSYDSAMRTRVVLYLIGVGLHLEKKFKIPVSGGCKLGSRTIKPHFYAFEKLGKVKIKTTENFYEIESAELKGNEIIMYESGDTATNNAILAAVMAEGKSTIKFASANYMVQELCCFLNQMGAKIRGIGTTTLEIEGVGELRGVLNYSIMPDPIESMGFITIAIMTNSEITVKQCPKDFVELELLKLEKMGFKYDILKKYQSPSSCFELMDIKTKKSELKALEEKIYGRPYPGLNIDNLPYFVPIATQAEGQTLIHDWVYENRAIYYVEFQKLGANILLADPHRVYITGKTPIQPAEVVCPKSLRPSVLILMAMLGAKGKSILRNIYNIERGYEDLAGRLKALGADIERVNGGE